MNENNVADVGDLIRLEDETEVFEVIGRYFEGEENIGVHYLVDGEYQYTAIDGSYIIVKKAEK